MDDREQKKPTEWYCAACGRTQPNEDPDPTTYAVGDSEPCVACGEPAVVRASPARRAELPRAFLQERLARIEREESSSTMPLVCDRCGCAVAAGQHYLFSFDLWSDGRPRNASGIPNGRVCDPCAVVVQDELVELAKKTGLTCQSGRTGHRFGDRRALTSVGRGAKEVLEKTEGHASWCDNPRDLGDCNCGGGRPSS